VSLTELGADSLAEVDSLRQAIGWGGGSWFLRPMCESGGCVLGVRDDAGHLIAMGAAARFEPFGFICNMVVEPTLKRGGRGRAVFESLLSWLRERGIESVQLEATEEGKPLYEQYGFRPRWESITALMGGPVERGDEDGIAGLSADDWPEISALDRAAIGGDRTRFLQLLAAGPDTLGGLVLREDGRLTGFGFRFPGRIGPLVAANEAGGERLARALAARSPEGTFATVGHPMHGAMWERLGLELAPFDVRMAVGERVADQPGMVFSMLNGGVG